jgi:hypothetical protein
MVFGLRLAAAHVVAKWYLWRSPKDIAKYSPKNNPRKPFANLPDARNKEFHGYLAYYWLLTYRHKSSIRPKFKFGEPLYWRYSISFPTFEGSCKAKAFIDFDSKGTIKHFAVQPTAFRFDNEECKVTLVAAQQCTMALVAEVARHLLLADFFGHPLSYFNLKPNIPVLTIKGGATHPLLTRFATRDIMKVTPDNDLQGEVGKVFGSTMHDLKFHFPGDGTCLNVTKIRWGEVQA